MIKWTWTSGCMGLVVLLGGASLVHAKPTAAQKCVQGKDNEAGKYAACRLKARAKDAIKPDPDELARALQKCADKFAAKWDKVEDKGGCPKTDDQGPIQLCLDGITTGVADAIAGGALVCGAAVPGGQLLKTGQTTCWDADGAVIVCAGTGQDGELQKGLARAYVDNGNGTITDTKTGLMWEKLDDNNLDPLHDKDTLYGWANAFAVKVATLNWGGGFAGYTDWRLPNVNELHSLVNYGVADPAVSPAFNTACSSGCTVLTCSCTTSSFYWSSTTDPYIPSQVWGVDFIDGDVNGPAKSGSGKCGAGCYVRAVRGGS